ncbi:MAG TPA: stage II sporulation protein E [Planctomycetaceae bacterium]|nr:stage II sporulation protein E [Planctomycetaceae bacterium]HCD02133.1 stage II sporulation protein E [Planctomycetaceae bacterium]
MAVLVLLQGGEAIPHDLGAEDVLIGRHPECGVQLESNAVSRRHARVFVEGGGYAIEDLGSGNGTFVNGQKIEGPTQLSPQDRIKLGPVLMRFEESGGGGTAAEQDFGTTMVGVSLDDDDATIMASVDIGGGFGALGVKPEEKLKGVLEISRALAGSVDVEALLPKVLDTLFGIFNQADRGCILLKEPESGELVPRAMKHRRESEDATVTLSRTIVSKVIEDKAGLLSADASSDTQFSASESISNLSIRSMMCVPMLGIDGEVAGVINLDTQNPVNQFNNDDLELLQAVAGQAALSYESARLASAFMAKQKQDSELDIARGVQVALLPEELPKVEGYSFFASYDAAQAVGGDYYDAMILSDGKICLAFGDVAGKGVPGALIMSRMSSCVQNTMSFRPSIEEAVTAINNHMCANAVEGRFVTFVLVIIDPVAHHLTLVNAGHMSPMILTTDGQIEEFDEESVGLPIGVMEDYPFEVVERPIVAGEIIVIFTDGVDEAMNPAGDLYTLERMRNFLQAGSRQADELGRSLLADVRTFADGRDQNDDITIMTFGRDALV